MSSSSEFASITSSESDLITVDLANKVQTLGLNQIERHIFICADQTKPLCCSKEQSLEAWDYLKKRLTELKLDQVTEGKPSCTFRTKANCLRVCTHGTYFSSLSRWGLVSFCNIGGDWTRFFKNIF